MIESTSTTNQNIFEDIRITGVLLSLAFVCLALLASGCATLSGGLPTAASSADEYPSEHWQEREPGMAPDVTTPEWFEADTVEPGEASAAADEEWLGGPSDRDALYYLRGSSRPMPEQRWHVLDGSASHEAYPAMAGYGSPGS